MANIKLTGRIIICCEIEALTGLHIGGNTGSLEIGGLDNPVIRNGLSREPYIPGSSLRGKMRSQLEKKMGSEQNQSVGKAKIHVCKGVDAGDICPVCRIFGLSASENGATPTRLLIRDTALTEDSKTQLLKAHTDLLFTETKTEVAIDRITSAASPRNLERVPAGTVFGPAELVFSIYEKEDIDLLDNLLDCLQLTEDDYLGGSGSRGSGKIRFKNIRINARLAENYSSLEDLGNYENILELTNQFPELKKKIGSVMYEKG